MSVRNPLITELKGYVRKFIEDGSEITDSTENLPLFCKCLEKAFQNRVSFHLNPIGIPTFPDAWFWMEEISKRDDQLLYSYSSIVESIQKNEKVQESVGKIRLLIRNCLNRKCLHVPVAFIIRKSNLASHYYEPDSIIGDEILGEIFYSVLLQISSLTFRLNLKNSSFLDETWEIPETVTIEYVPCKLLGISICFTGGKALITKIEKNSVAAEDERVQVGDVLDEINGNYISTYTRGNLKKIMNKAVGHPVKLHIIKYRNGKDEKIYEPIADVIKNSGIENLKWLLTSSNSLACEALKKNEKHVIKDDAEARPGFAFDYCGSIEIGSKGDVKQIEKAIKAFLQSKTNKNLSIRFECLELGIKVTQINNSEVILNQSYMEISSCGRSSLYPDYFAFVSSDTNCNVAKLFHAYIFYHENHNEILSILQSLGQGFYRTHFAV